jgi:hypothetical protein
MQAYPTGAAIMETGTETQTGGRWWAKSKAPPRSPAQYAQASQRKLRFSRSCKAIRIKTMAKQASWTFWTNPMAAVSMCGVHEE